MYTAFFVYMYIYTPRVPDAHRDQKGASDAPELKLQMDVSHHMGTGN